VPEPSSFDYAVVRIVPRVDRDEFVNAGVIVFSPQRRLLDARIHIDVNRLRALWPSIDLALVKRHLEAIPRICAGDQEAGPIAKLSLNERFHWLTSPRSTMIQISPVRTGLAEEPEKMLDRLAHELLEVR